MTREPFIAHSELTNEIYIIVGKEKYRVTEQAIKAVMAIKTLKQESVFDKIRAEIESCREDAEPHLCDYKYHRNEGLDMALDILDKYKAESE